MGPGNHTGTITCSTNCFKSISCLEMYSLPLKRETRLDCTRNSDHVIGACYGKTLYLSSR